MMGLLRTLSPEWWFSAHLHCRFEATVVHKGLSQTGSGDPASASASAEKTNPDEINIEDEDENGGESASANAGADAGKEESPAVQRSNPDEITLDDEEDEVEAPPPPPPPSAETKFLALDKCLPRRQFLEVCTRSCIAV